MRRRDLRSPRTFVSQIRQQHGLEQSGVRRSLQADIVVVAESRLSVHGGGKGIATEKLAIVSNDKSKSRLSIIY